ncbi:MAG: hypothetical protein WAW42_01750 [Candidatus Competibacteraceae bacterium]
MINTAKLQSAKIHTTQHNDTLKALWGTVQVYNTTANLPKIEKIYILERILLGAGEWLTSHPPTTTATNQARWAAMDDLAKQAIDEGAKLDARFLTGPTNWKTISHANRSYWLEYLSPKHRVGFELAPLFEHWRTHGAAHQTFWEYVNIAAPYGASLVKYYGATAKAEKRRVIFKEDGKLYRATDDTPFHTALLETAASGHGWAIFVVSPEGKMYAHKHVVGKYHHSTFLSGSAVIAAGELVADHGVVKFVTAKSGHYVPTIENMRTFVRQFPKIPPSAVIMPNFTPNPPPAHRVGEFKFTASPKALKRAEALAALPVWARDTGAMGMINKIPV